MSKKRKEPVLEDLNPPKALTEAEQKELAAALDVSEPWKQFISLLARAIAKSWAEEQAAKTKPQAKPKRKKR